MSYRRIYESSSTVPRSDSGKIDVLEAHLIWTSKFAHRAFRNGGFRIDEEKGASSTELAQGLERAERQQPAY
jgi:hypothetical protein